MRPPQSGKGKVSPTFSAIVSLSLLLSSSGAVCAYSNQMVEELSISLVSRGFENVVVTESPESTVKVYYENRIYRYPMRAMGVVLAQVDDGIPGPWSVTVVPMRAGVPIVSVTANHEYYKRFISGEIDAETFAESLVISTSPPAPDLDEAENRSFRRLDISAGPSVSVEFEQIDDSMRGRLNIVPQVESSPARGLLATAQLVLPVIDEIEEPDSGVRPGRATLDWLSRKGPVTGLARAGIFNQQRYGFSLGAGRWTWGDRILLAGRGDLTGKLALDDGVWEYSDIEVFTYSLGATYWYPMLDVTLKAEYGRFLGEENGARVDLTRAIGELEIGFFAIKTESDTLAGFTVDIPLPVSRYSKPGAVRLKTVPHFIWEYRDEVTAKGLMPGGGLSVNNLYKSLAPVFIRNNVSEWIEARRLI